MYGWKNRRGPPFKKMSGHVMLFMRSYMLLRGMGSSLNVTVPVMKHLAEHAREGLKIKANADIHGTK